MCLQRCLGQRSWHKSVVLGNSVARRCRYDSLEKEVLLGCGGTSIRGDDTRFWWWYCTSVPPLVHDCGTRVGGEPCGADITV